MVKVTAVRVSSSGGSVVSNRTWSLIQARGVPIG